MSYDYIIFLWINKFPSVSDLKFFLNYVQFEIVASVIKLKLTSKMRQTYFTQTPASKNKADLIVAVFGTKISNNLAVNMSPPTIVIS